MTKRRWLFRIALCLALGVVTTMGISVVGSRYSMGEDYTQVVLENDMETWMSWTVRSNGSASPPAESEEAAEWMRREWNRRAFDSEEAPPGIEVKWGIQVGERRGILADEAAFVGWWRDQSQFEYHRPIDIVLFEVRRWVGWPMRSFATRVRTDDPPWGIDFYEYAHKLSLDESSAPDIRPPFALHSYRPRWFGFTVNSVVFTATWFLLMSAITALTRVTRKRRGLCPMCKYNLRGNPEGVTDCAECGWGRTP